MTMHSAGATATLASGSGTFSSGYTKIAVVAHASANAPSVLKQWQLYLRWGSDANTTDQIDLGIHNGTSDTTAGDNVLFNDSVFLYTTTAETDLYLVAIPQAATYAWYDDGGSSITVSNPTPPPATYHPENGAVLDPLGFFEYYRTGGTGFNFATYGAVDAGSWGEHFDQAGSNVGNIVDWAITGPATVTVYTRVPGHAANFTLSEINGLFGNAAGIIGTVATDQPCGTDYTFGVGSGTHYYRLSEGTVKVGFGFDGITVDAAPSAPTADFSGTPTSGLTPLTVAFTDLSSDGPTSWAWDFGDSGTSTSQNPSHVYAAAGTYTVELVATNDSGSDTETKVAYITVTDPVPGVVLDPTAADPVPITDDIISWHIQRGQSAEITGAASTGTATLVLKNSVEAGADEDDKYNPDNAGGSLLAYLKDGTAIHWAVNEDGTLTGTDPVGMFGGRTKDWTVLPAEGATVAPTVEVTCEDALGWYGRTPVTLSYARGRSQREIREAILTAAEETRTDLDNEISTVPLSGGEGTALSLLEELNKANGTRHFVRPADVSDQWYTYVTRNRQYNLDGTSDYSLNQQTDHVTSMDGWRLSADTVTNQQKATVTPIRFTPSTYPVWTTETLPVAVTADRPFEVWVEFDDYVAAPLVNSAYTGTTPTITIVAFGTTAHLTITVASGTCTFTALSIEGSIARRLPQQSWVADDLTSQALPRGVRAGSEISGEYVGNLSTARGIAEHVVWRYATPQRRPTVTVTNWLPYQFQVELGDLIAYTSPQLGVTARLFEVVGITHDAAMAAATGVSHTSQFVLQECRVQSDPGWFVLDTSELDSSDVLAY